MKTYDNHKIYMRDLPKHNGYMFEWGSEMYINLNVKVRTNEVYAGYCDVKRHVDSRCVATIEILHFSGIDTLMTIIHECVHFAESFIDNYRDIEKVYLRREFTAELASSLAIEIKRLVL